jgi:hypothetical protein
MAETYSDRNDTGWIALARSSRFHPIVGCGQPVKPADAARGSYSRFEAWVDLLMLACHKTSVWMNKGHKVELQAGELPGAYSFLASRWNWTVKTVRGFLEKLIKEGMTGKPRSDQDESKQGKQKSNQVQIISICNYSTYQVAREIAKIQEGQAEGKRGASEGQESNKITIRQEVREESSLRSDSAPSPSADAAAAEAELELDDPGKTIWSKCVPWLIEETGKPEPVIKRLVGKWQKTLTHHELLQAFRSTAKAKKANAGLDPVQYIGKIVSQAQAVMEERCRRENGRIVVVNGFKAEISDILAGRDLQRSLDRINGRIPQHVVGIDLEAKVRALAIELVDQSADQDRRYKAAAAKKKPAYSYGHYQLDGI